MEPAGGLAWPARGGPGDGSSLRREIPSSPAWEPPQKKLRNNAFHSPASTYPSQETVNYAREDGQGLLPSLSHHPPAHAAGEQLYGERESFGPFSHGQGMPAYGGQQQMQSGNFNMAPQSATPTPGFPPGSAKGTGALFLKTKLCTKFKLGTCTFNERCHFAHGMEDLRKPPAGWETMVVSAGQGSPFPDGKECPYGDRCTFVHVAGDDAYPASGFGSSDGRGLPTPRLKTRMCARWERGEACNYGERCHYAHGYAELQSDNGVSAYSNDNAPAANKVQYSNPSLETPPFVPQFSHAKPMNAPPAAAPLGGLHFMTTTNAPPSNAYPTTGTGAQPAINPFIGNQGYWNGTSAQGGVLETQISGLWAGHNPIVEGGYSKDLPSSGQYLPAQAQQLSLGQSYATGNVVTYQDPKLSVNGIYQDPKQSVHVPYVQDGGSNNYGIYHQDPKQTVHVPYGQDGANTNFQTEALGGNGAYYPATYLPNPPA
ncbi:hypothetical protein GOP47_0027736 [Adiantum capillus-veneris]|nr:hypothetical protein GOP47_0027736 [Adiantum capillus-veneris]